MHTTPSPHRGAPRRGGFRLHRFTVSCLMMLLPALAAFIFAAAARAQEMPLAPSERLWSVPGPEQAGPGAPKLLIVYPLANAAPSNEPVARYAGRVEPASAAVMLNGKPLTIYPGGVFTGTLARSGAPSETWRFEASTQGRKTIVERTLSKESTTEPAQAWPLSFYSSPATPTGAHWLRPGDSLTLTLYASPGHRAQFRIGERGRWQAMTGGERDANHGGVYRAMLAAPHPAAIPRLEPVYFRLSGSHDGNSASREIKSSLRVATLRPDRQLWGRVTANVATYLKNGSPSDWERWGNFIKDTPFPIREGNGERVRVDFGKGEPGWLETEAIELDKDYRRHPRPSLAKPRISVARQALTLAWPNVKTPVACVFYPSPAAGGGAELRISLPGAGGLRHFETTPRQGGFVSVEGTSSRRDTPPAIRIRLDRPLWGYAMTCDSVQGMRLVIRTRPSAGAAGKPLAGLRIMLDAGHGGASFGERGPSGLLEKDINLVQSAWLERNLAALGAEVKQVRASDVDINLDARVDAALAWNPDLFISLHHNSVGMQADPLSDTGPISFYHYAHSKPLADAIADSMASRLKAEKGARSRTNVFRVNRNISLCPAVLIESAYICNPYDEIKLRQAGTLKTSAEAIAQGVKKLFAE